MTYAYILQSVQDKKTVYIGSTTDLRQRVKAHQGGGSRTMERYFPMRLVYYEAFKDAQEARDRDQGLKQFGGAYRHLMRRIKRNRLGVLIQAGAG